MRCKIEVKELREEGKTMVFVTHSMPVVESLCTRAVWLSNGKIKMDGEVHKVAEAYLKETV